MPFQTEYWVPNDTRSDTDTSEERKLMRGLIKACAVLVAVLAFAVGVAACGSSGSSSSSSSSSSEETTSSSGEGKAASASEGNTSIDLGNKKIEVAAGTKPKIGVFVYGVSAYELTAKRVAEEMNKEGSDVTYLEANNDPAVQLKQIQTALTTGEYDGWIIEPMDPEGECKILTEQAPEKNIPVSVITQPICGRALEPWGEELWAPGSLNFIGDNSNVTFWTNVLKEQKKFLGIGPDTKVWAINGVHLTPESQAWEQALKAAGIEPVETLEGDFTAPTAQKLTAAMLARNPEVEVILDSYEGATPGIIAALKQAGKSPGEVKVGDGGGSSEISVPNIKSGWLTVSAVYDPEAIARSAIEQMELAFADEQGPRILPAGPPGGTVTKPFLLTKENVGEFEPTY